MRQFILCLALVSLALAAGCAGKRMEVVLLPEADGTVGQVDVRTDGGSQTLKGAYESTTAKDKGKTPEAVVVRDTAEIDEEFGAALSAQPVPPRRFLLYFQSGGTQLTAESTTLLPEIVAVIQERSSRDTSIVGHSDRVGSEEYNLKLSTERARAVADLLLAQGVDESILEITSHGEGNPLIPTQDDVAEPRNRRVEVTVR